MQLAPKSIGVPFSRPLNVAETKYAADVDAQTGFCAPYLVLPDIDGDAVDAGKAMGATAVCPCQTGACVSSVTGGVVVGWDMYGQYIEETIGAASDGTIAFAGLTSYPADALWTNQYGLPYKYSAAAATPNASITITPSAADEDSRGTIAYSGAYTNGEATVEVPYVADRDALFGAPYDTRFATPAAAADDEFAGTVASTGAISITQTLVADTSQYVFYTFADGYQVRYDNGADTVNHTLSALWMSQYAADWADVDVLVSAVTEAGTKIVINLTGSLT